MTDAPKPQRFIITLQAGKHPQPAAVRLRRLLKIAGRALGLRCVGCREVTEPRPSTEEVTE